MKIHIEGISSEEIRCVMKQDSYTTAELLGTYQHPNGTVRLYRAADQLVFDTDPPVWDGMTEFAAFAAECGVDPREHQESEESETK